MTLVIHTSDTNSIVSTLIILYVCHFLSMSIPWRRLMWGYPRIGLYLFLLCLVIISEKIFSWISDVNFDLSTGSKRVGEIGQTFSCFQCDSSPVFGTARGERSYPGFTGYQPHWNLSLWCGHTHGNLFQGQRVRKPTACAMNTISSKKLSCRGECIKLTMYSLAQEGVILSLQMKPYRWSIFSSVYVILECTLLFSAANLVARSSTLADPTHFMAACATTFNHLVVPVSQNLRSAFTYFYYCIFDWLMRNIILLCALCPLYTHSRMLVINFPLLVLSTVHPLALIPSYLSSTKASIRMLLDGVLHSKINASSSTKTSTLTLSL